jgi:hypothetical protein
MADFGVAYSEQTVKDWEQLKRSGKVKQKA